jgi:hypothetical protein
LEVVSSIYKEYQKELKMDTIYGRKKYDKNATGYLKVFVWESMK